MKHIILLLLFIILAGTITLSADVTVYLDPAYGTDGKNIQLQLTIENLNDPGFPKPKHHQPVLFVHDHFSDGEEHFRSFREALALRENARLGIEPYYIALEGHEYSDNAAKIKDAVELILLHQDDPGANRKKTAIIAFGNGAISARFYLKQLWENQGKRLSFHPVSELIAVSPPNHGMEGMKDKDIDFIETLNGHPLDHSKPGNYRGQVFDSEAPGSRRNNEPVKNGILYVTLYAAGNRSAKNLSPNAENREIAVHRNTVHMPEVVCKALYAAAYHRAPPDELPFKLADENNLKSPPIVPELQIQKQTTGIVLLMDISDSMSQYLPPAIKAAENFIKKMNDYRETNVAVAVFPPLPWNVREACGARNITPMALLSNKSKNNALKTLAYLKTKGKTPLLEGIDTALQLFDGEKRKIIILFSDGNHNCPGPVETASPDTAMDALMDKLEKNRVTLYAIGAGPPQQVNHRLLRRLAENTKENQKGNYFHIIAPEITLDETYTSIFTEIFPDPGLNVQTGFDRNGYGTGETVTFTTAITKGGVPVNGLKSVTASVTRPLVGTGNWHASNKVSEKELESVPVKMGDEVLTDLQRKTIYLAETRKIPPPGRSAPEALQLYDDGTHGDKKREDGIYTGQYTNTQTEGTYSFRVFAAGNDFKREKTVQTHVAVKPDAGHSVPVTRWLDTFPGDPVLYLYDVKLIPKDRYGNHPGPGHSVRVNVVYRERGDDSFTTRLKDNMNGTYTGRLSIPRSEFKAGALMEFTIDHKQLAAIEKIPGFKKWSLGFFAGTGVPIYSFNQNYDPAISFGCSAGYHLTPKFSALFVMGYHFFTAGSSITDNTNFRHISVNLRSQIIKNPMRLYINAGAGVYISKSGTVKRGINFGTGASYSLKENWNLELGADLHLVNTIGPDPNFLLTYARMVYRF